MSKHLLRALGLSLLAALGLMAFAASGAQAANLTAPWTHGKIIILGKEKLEASVLPTPEMPVSLLVPNFHIEITCKTFHVFKGLLNFTAEEGHGEVEILFLECQVFEIEKTLPFNLVNQTPLPCLILNPVNGEDGSFHVQTLVLIVLHEGQDYLILEDLNLTPPISKIVFTAKIGCPIPLKPEVKGSVPFLIETGDLHTGSAVEGMLIQGGGHSLPSLLGTKLLYGTTEGFVDGMAKLKLIGEHKGCTWGVL
jgi:hypothetical protein